jgi:hypothetical protein
VQKHMRHSDIRITLDPYGHVGDDFEFLRREVDRLSFGPAPPQPVSTANNQPAGPGGAQNSDPFAAPVLPTHREAAQHRDPGGDPLWFQPLPAVGATGFEPARGCSEEIEVRRGLRRDFRATPAGWRDFGRPGSCRLVPGGTCGFRVGVQTRCKRKKGPRLAIGPSEGAVTSQGEGRRAVSASLLRHAERLTSALTAREKVSCAVVGQAAARPRCSSPPRRCSWGASSLATSRCRQIPQAWMRRSVWMGPPV